MVSRSSFRTGAAWGTLVAAAAASSVASPARAADETFPARPITIVVPYGPGTPPDTYSRLFAEKLRPLVRQSVIIDNRPGASTTIGMTYAARAKPDGYTIVYGSNSSLAAAPSLFKSVPYDPLKSFSAIAVTYEAPMILIARPEDAPAGLDGMLRRMRAQPGGHPIGGGAITQEVINGMLQRDARIDQPYVRYNSAALWTDVIGGRLSMGIGAMQGAAPLVESNKIAVLAVTSRQRLAGKWKHIPTVAETLPGFALTSWIGFWVPAGTPAGVIRYLHEKTTQVIKDPEFVRHVEDSGAATVLMTPEESDAFVRTEGPRWDKLLKNVGIEPQ